MCLKKSGLPWAKTNLIGKARERWLQAEATIPNSTEWEVFKGALTPLFSDADKREKAKATYERLKSRGCSQMTEDALQDFGCKFLEAYNDMGPSKPVTEEGALDGYIKGLPSEARAMALLTKSFEPAHFKNLHNAILKVTELACGMVPEISAYHPDRAPARKGKHARGHDSSNGSGPSKKPRMEQAPVVAKIRNELMADPSIRGYADKPEKMARDILGHWRISSRRKTGASAVGSQGTGLGTAPALMFQVESRKSLLARDSHVVLCQKTRMPAPSGGWNRCWQS